MSRYDETCVLNPPISRAREWLTVRAIPYAGSRCMLYLNDSLCAPLDGKLRHNIEELLRHGERIIVLDLAWISRIDAAGVGELVHAYNAATAAQSVLQIVHATPRVRRILERVGLFEILSGDRTQPVTTTRQGNQPSPTNPPPLSVS
jgi:anti-anti-sigma factor